MLAEQIPADSGFSASEPGIPPATLGLIAANSLVFCMPDGVELWDVCLSPFCVLDKREYSRLATSAVVHFNATHLLSNLTTVVPDAMYIERTQGSAALLGELAAATLLSHSMYVGMAWLQKHYMGQREVYYSPGAIGFSAAAFALKVATGAKRSGQTHFFGFSIPSQYNWVLGIALTHLCVPEASFAGHMCGVVAGIVRAYILGPLVSTLSLGAVGGGTRYTGNRRYNWGSGTVSGRSVRRGGGGLMAVKRGLSKAFKQLGLAAAVSAAFWVLKQQQARAYSSGSGRYLR